MNNDNSNNKGLKFTENTLRERISRRFKGVSAGSLIIFALAMLAYFAVPALATQPGTDDDPLVTRRVLNARVAELEAEIAELRGLIGLHGMNTPQAPQIPTTPDSSHTPDLASADVNRLMADLMRYIDARIDASEPSSPEQIHFIPAGQQMPPFTVLHLHPGQAVTFDAGAEFILRGGAALALTGEINGIPDVTGGRDVMNGANIEQNHLMIIPATDGRGIIFTAESWLMVRGGYTLVH
ncbi:MAG: hypothetical protein FWF77_09180 [Defluviitaleaceae bacterium]|nr:hypothetical protein [Defluviitaleaceae bacterium]